MKDQDLPVLPFHATDVFGQMVDLAQLQQLHPYVLLVFLRYSGCPWCNLAIHRLTLEYAELTRRGCQVIAFVQSERENIIRDIYDSHDPRPPFPIIPDPTMEVYRQYHVRVSIKDSLRLITDIPYWLRGVQRFGFKQIDGNLFVVPAWFLINTQTNSIVKHEYNANFYDHESFIALYDSLIFKD